MPTPLSDGDILEARFVCATQNQVGINVRHYVVTNSTGLGASIEQAVAKLDLAFNADYQAVLSAEARYRGVGLRRLLPVATAEFVSTALAGDGMVAGDLMPKQVSGVITLKSSLPGRNFRGRVYVPFPSETDNDLDSTPTATYMANLQALATRFTLAVVAGVGADLCDLTPVIRSRKLGLNALIVSARENDRWGTQRRRGDYGAMNFPPF